MCRITFHLFFVGTIRSNVHTIVASSSLQDYTRQKYPNTLLHWTYCQSFLVINLKSSSFKLVYWMYSKCIVVITTHFDTIHSIVLNCILICNYTLDSFDSTHRFFLHGCFHEVIFLQDFYRTVLTCWSTF